ncbi:MAG: UDP-N-acetylglucosamine 2-epimerase (non-hydrolyzing) [Armatimonadetes bacterium]|nr:UDP-N-acetylglucosamine 2-epimerase (non-hydrolyzing) [Armatimonadota bacterium]
MSRPLHILCIIGTRPDALKMAPVVLELRRFPDQVRTTLVATGQHREMLQQVLDVFDLRPDVDLAIMQARQTLAQITCRALEGLDPIFTRERPDIVLVQGDTTTTFVASLAAFYHQVPVGHVEAGLRTDNRYDPFPEEINRRLTTALTTVHFAPTPAAVANLRAEGVPAEAIHLVGNTVIDALLMVATRPYEETDPTLRAALADGRRLALVTAHRRENLGEPLARICAAIQRVVREHPDVQCVFQMHRNPAVREVVTGALAAEPRVRLVEPQEYRAWVNLMKRCTLVLTDSGGIQEEAPALGKPVLVMRETTERPEGIEAGTAELVGTQTAAIAAAAHRLLTDEEAYQRMARAVNPYGDGHAAERICEVLLQKLGDAE